jgi:hypothetical protein
MLKLLKIHKDNLHRYLDIDLLNNDNFVIKALNINPSVFSKINIKYKSIKDIIF